MTLDEVKEAFLKYEDELLKDARPLNLAGFVGQLNETDQDAMVEYILAWVEQNHPKIPRHVYESYNRQMRAIDTPTKRRDFYQSLAAS